MSTNISQRESSRIQDKPVSQEQRTKEAKDAFLGALKSSGTALDNEFQARAKLIHANAKELEKQDKKVQKATKQTNKEADSIEKFLKKSRKTLPDIDSFEAEMARLEADLDMFDDMMDQVENRDTDQEPGHASDNGSAEVATNPRKSTD